MKVGQSLCGVYPPTTATVLTYDDGPVRGATDAVLGELADAGARATFFVLLSRVRRDPGLLEEVLAAGHEVGLHGIDHRRLTDLDPDQVAGSLRDGRHELEDAVCGSVRWFRPPYGAQSRATWQAAADAGLTPVMWSIACEDWLTLEPEAYLAHVRGRTLRGEIVLLHDGYADASSGVDDGPAPELDRAALTRGVLELASEQGLRALTVSAAVEGATPRWEIRLDDESELVRRLRRRLTGSGRRLR